MKGQANGLIQNSSFNIQNCFLERRQRDAHRNRRQLRAFIGLKQGGDAVRSKQVYLAITHAEGSSVAQLCYVGVVVILVLALIAHMLAVGIYQVAYAAANGKFPGVIGIFGLEAEAQLGSKIHVVYAQLVALVAAVGIEHLQRSGNVLQGIFGVHRIGTAKVIAGAKATTQANTHFA